MTNLKSRMVHMVAETFKQMRHMLPAEYANMVDYVCDAERLLVHGKDSEAYKAFCKLGIGDRNEVLEDAFLRVS